MLWITQGSGVDGLFGSDFGRRTVTDEQRLATPFEGNGLALRDVGQLDFDLGHGQHIGRGTHRRDEGGHQRLGHVGGCDGGT